MSLKQIETTLQAMRRLLHRTQDVEKLRRSLEASAAASRLEADITMTPVQAGDVPAAYVSATTSRAGYAMLYFHGGGYIIGSVKSHAHLASRISREIEATVLLPAYRLAPEHPFPAAVEDGVTAYLWMLQQGYAPDKLAVGGDSAGGGLALATLLALKGAGHPLPRCVILLSPWVDLSCEAASLELNADKDPVLSKPWCEAAARHYLAGQDPRSPLASPLKGDLSGLPPVLIQVGGAEVLYDDAARLFERLETLDVPAALQVWPEMVHTFHLFGPALDEADAALMEIGIFVTGRWEGRTLEEDEKPADALMTDEELEAELGISIGDVFTHK